MVGTIRFLCKNVIRYDATSLVSLETLEWTKEKQDKLEKKAVDLFNKNIEHGHLPSSIEEDLASLYANKGQKGIPFVKLSDLLEQELPKLGRDGKIKWQRCLLIDLIERMDNVNVLGVGRRIYIVTPNKYKIQNLEDVICFILENEFHGKAKEDKLIKRLDELEISKKIYIDRAKDEPAKFMVKKNEVTLC